MENLELNILSKNQVLEMQLGLSENILGAVHYTCNSHSTFNEFIAKFEDWLIGNGQILS